MVREGDKVIYVHYILVNKNCGSFDKITINKEMLKSELTEMQKQISKEYDVPLQRVGGSFEER